MKEKKPKKIKSASASIASDELVDTVIPQNNKPKTDSPAEVAEKLATEETGKKERKPYTKRVKEESLFDETSFKPLITVACYFVNDRCPNKIEPTDAEISMISKAVQECLNKYGGTIAEYMPLVTLAGSTAMFLVPRLIPQQEVFQPENITQ
jgi:hypothetical protein